MRRNRSPVSLASLLLFTLAAALLLSSCTGIVTNIQRNVQCDADATAVGRRNCIIIQTPPPANSGESHDH